MTVRRKSFTILIFLVELTSVEFEQVLLRFYKRKDNNLPVDVPKRPSASTLDLLLFYRAFEAGIECKKFDLSSTFSIQIPMVAWAVQMVVPV